MPKLLEWNISLLISWSDWISKKLCIRNPGGRRVPIYILTLRWNALNSVRILCRKMTPRYHLRTVRTSVSQSVSPSVSQFVSTSVRTPVSIVNTFVRTVNTFISAVSHPLAIHKPPVSHPLAHPLAHPLVHPLAPLAHALGPLAHALESLAHPLAPLAIFSMRKVAGSSPGRGGGAFVKK